MSKNRFHIRLLKLAVAVILICGIVMPALHAQSSYVEEIIVRFEVPKLIQKDIFVQYNGETIFLPVIDLFTLLEISVEGNIQEGIIHGNFVTKNEKFEIDLLNAKAKCYGNTINLDNTMIIQTQTDIFLRIDLFKELFKLNLNFDFTELTVFLPLNTDFPAYIKLKRQLAYKRLKNEKVKALDIQYLPYKRELFKAGIVDWMVSASPLGNQAQFFQMNLGSMLLGGDLSVQGGGNSVRGFETDRINYRWHYFAEKGPYLSQVIIGEVNPGGFLARNLKGFLVTNKPQIREKYFQTSTIEGVAPGENWDIELYINNVLVDYTRTDQSGMYTFLIDIEYGSTRTMVKKYGPNGEIEIDEKFITVPHTLLKKNKIEYTLAAGMQSSRVEAKKYVAGNFYYGLFNSLTFGINTEAPIKSDSSNTGPAAALDMNYKLRGDLLLSGSYSPGHSMNGGFNFRIPGFINTNGNYTIYNLDSERNTLHKSSTGTLSLSAPFKYKRNRLTLRYRLSIDQFPDRQIAHTNFGASISAFKIHINFIGNYKKTTYESRYISLMASQIFASTSLVRFIRPQFRFNYDHKLNELTKAGIYLNKRIFRRGQLTLSLERNMQSHSNTIMATFHIFNGFADFSSKIISSGDNYSMVQTQKGSVQFNQDAKRFRFNRRNGVGFGSAVIRPFLDANYNGKLDDEEEILTGLRAKMAGAAISHQGKDDLWYYDRLRPYDQYTIDIDEYSLDNPLLLPSAEAYEVLINPNSVTSIYVPIITAGEITGMVERKIDKGTIGVGGVKIIAKNEKTGKEFEIITFNNGEYFHLGLPPGMYRAFVPDKQLENTGYKVQPTSIPFQIKTVENGDYVDNLNFILVKK